MNENSGQSAESAGQASDQQANQLADWKVALEVAAGDLDLLLEVLDAFRLETPQAVSSIRTALEARDAKLLHRSAHTVKNACYNLGAQGPAERAFQIEKYGKDARFDDVAPVLEKLEVDMRQIDQEVEQFVRQQRGG
jgi:HPt (histidine-containing phosphotransfer) domain-containing protein